MRSLAIALVFVFMGGLSANGQTLTSDPGPSDLRDQVERFAADRAALHRRYDVDSPTRHDRLRAFYREWEEALNRKDYDGLNLQGKIDYQLLRNRLSYETRRLDIDRERYQEALESLPFLPDSWASMRPAGIWNR